MTAVPFPGVYPDRGSGNLYLWTVLLQEEAYLPKNPGSEIHRNACVQYISGNPVDIHDDGQGLPAASDDQIREESDSVAGRFHPVLYPGRQPGKGENQAAAA